MFTKINAGRRSKRGRAYPAASDANLLKIGSAELAQMATPAALAELHRRGRGPDGKKLAWQKARKNPFRRATDEEIDRYLTIIANSDPDGPTAEESEMYDILLASGWTAREIDREAQIRRKEQNCGR